MSQLIAEHNFEKTLNTFIEYIQRFNAGLLLNR